MLSSMSVNPSHIYFCCLRSFCQALKNKTNRNKQKTKQNKNKKQKLSRLCLSVHEFYFNASCVLVNCMFFVYYCKQNVTAPLSPLSLTVSDLCEACVPVLRLVSWLTMDVMRHRCGLLRSVLQVSVSGSRGPETRYKCK